MARKRVSRKQEETFPQENLEDLYENAPCGYVSTLLDGTFAKVNQTFLDLVGYRREELLANRRLQDLLTVAGKIYYETHCAPLLQMQGFVNEIAIDLITHDGQRLPVLLNSIQKRDASGRLILNRTTIFNASGRREYEREILLTRKKAEQTATRIARLQSITATLVESVSRAQVAEVIVQQAVAALNADAGLVAILSDNGDSLEVIHVIGSPMEVLEAGHRFPLDTPIPLTDAIRVGEPILIESLETLTTRFPQLTMAQSNTGQRSLAVIPLMADRHAVGVLELSFLKDQTFPLEDRAFLLTLARQCALALERARLYEAERVARADAQEAVRVRDAFFTVASHELRTPLTSLLGNAQFLLRQSQRENILSERDQQTLESIIEQAKRINKMISEMLDVGRIGSGQLSVERASLDINALASRIAEELQPTLTRHTLNYRAPSTPLIVNGDVLRLEQVLQNLIENALKYSPAGGPITVQLEQHDQMIYLTVTDKGIGIPQEALPNLFQRFYRAKNVDEQHITGLGIGLHVVKEIVTLHGGAVMVESQEGQGSTFRVCLPLAKTQISS